MSIATAKVATSAEEARDMRIIRPHDKVTLNRSRLIADAKTRVLEIAAAGYTQPTETNRHKSTGDVRVWLLSWQVLLVCSSVLTLRTMMLKSRTKQLG